MWGGTVDARKEHSLLAQLMRERTKGFIAKESDSCAPGGGTELEGRTHAHTHTHYKAPSWRPAEQITCPRGTKDFIVNAKHVIAPEVSADS
jgi:hypothetical protein